MNKTGFFLIIFCLFGRLFAQDSLPPAFEIRTDTFLVTELEPQQWQIFPDENGQLTINEVKLPTSPSRFRMLDTLRPDRNEHTKVFWIRYRVKNTMNHKANISLDSYSNRDDYYVFDQAGQVRHFVSGRSVPWKMKHGLKRRNFIPLVLQPGEEILVYDRSSNVKRINANQVKVTIVNTDKVIQEDFIDEQDNLYDRNIKITYFALGFFLLATCFNFLFFRTAREKTYLYLALYLFFLCVEILVESFTRTYPKAGLYSGIPMLLSQYFFLHFVRYYFDTFRYKPGWDKFLRVVNVLLLSYLAVILFFPGDPVISFTTLMIRLIILNLIFLVTYFLFRPFRKQAANFFAIALLPFLVFQLILGVMIFFLDMGVALYGPATWYIENANVIGTFCAAWSVLLFTWALFKRYDEQRKTIAQKELEKERLSREKELERIKLIEEQKTELEKRVAERTAALQHSLEDLKNTQSQLIQSEKMASLGELTSGIAHEIQNPLNFVNNFSEINTELIDELTDELKKNNTATVGIIAANIRDNESKIIFHGKRADAIVKSMLQHSRSSTGKKEPVDLNAMVDEYLRLSYHGLRAKNKSFQAKFETDLDPQIGQVNLVAQDIGRVLLNLINNAFYAVAEKQKQNIEGYEPIVSINTMKKGDQVWISVSDNGNGIEPEILDKIFQPFFTTKPTGLGTGLGLSLSYDIVKAHQGELKVETKENEGSVFTIVLPSE